MKRGEREGGGGRREGGEKEGDKERGRERGETGGGGSEA
mgnify:CR=1 FL=1